jgi:hypothetical protein
MGDESVGRAGTTDHKFLPRGFVEGHSRLPVLSNDASSKSIDDDSAKSFASQIAQPFARASRRAARLCPRRPIRRVGLLREMQTQIAFRHGRDGMMHHRGMTIDAVDSATAFRKQIREEHVSAKMRRRYNDRNDAAREKCLARFQARGRCCPLWGALSNVEQTLYRD